MYQNHEFLGYDRVQCGTQLPTFEKKTMPPTIRKARQECAKQNQNTYRVSICISYSSDFGGLLTPCSRVEIYWRVGRTRFSCPWLYLICCFAYFPTMKMKAARSPEPIAHLYRTRKGYNSVDRSTQVSVACYCQGEKFQLILKILQNSRIYVGIMQCFLMLKQLQQSRASIFRKDDWK